MIILTSPQMPTGCVISDGDIERIIMQNENSEAVPWEQNDMISHLSI